MLGDSYVCLLFVLFVVIVGRGAHLLPFVFPSVAIVVRVALRCWFLSLGTFFRSRHRDCLRGDVHSAHRIRPARPRSQAWRRAMSMMTRTITNPHLRHTNYHSGTHLHTWIQWIGQDRPRNPRLASRKPFAFRIRVLLRISCPAPDIYSNGGAC